MKNLEVSLNILHYCIYKAHYNLHLLFNKINPLNLVHKLPFQKRKYEELGIDINKQINKAFSDQKNGLSIMVAGGILFGILFFLLIAIINVLMIIINVSTGLSVERFAVCGLFSLIVCYLLVFKKDKYLEYFKQFDNWTKSERRKYGWISFMAIIIIFLIALASLSWYKH